MAVQMAVASGSCGSAPSTAWPLESASSQHSTETTTTMMRPTQRPTATTTKVTRSLATAMAMPLAGIQHRYPFTVKVDFMQLKTTSLQKYLRMYNLQEDPESTHQQIATIVARHFNKACQETDEESSIASFMGYLKGDATARLPKKRRVRCPEVLPSSPQSVNRPSDKSKTNDEKENTHTGANKKREQEEDTPSDDGSTTRKRKASTSITTDDADGSCAKKKKKNRKSRAYCVCKGSSFGNMIACDNKKCLDRSNWYHMSCVGLDPSNDPPETWFCPACQERDPSMDDIPENQYRKPVASVTYGEMISHALSVLPGGRGTFKEICDFVEKEYESQLNWKLERKSPVWKSSVRKILFSNMRFRKDPHDKAMFCLAS